MQLTKTIVRSVFILVLGGCLVLTSPPLAAQTRGSVPQVIQAGFNAWTNNGVDLALNVWQKGGLLERDAKINALSTFFRRIDRAVGNFLSYENLQTKTIGQDSQILYVALRFEHGAVYARFLLYRTEKSWVVQNMDFNTKPEAIMPWLAFEGGGYNE